MASPDWKKYPRVLAHCYGRTLLELEASLGNAQNTIDAYARAREAFFRYCEVIDTAPEQATREHIVGWIRELLSVDRSGQMGLSNATIQLRLTSVRLYFDYLIEKGLRPDNPVGRGRYTRGHIQMARIDRGLVPRQHKLPWIPNEEQWGAIVRAVELESLRNRTMFALSYDAALRREELCGLTTSDFDFAHHLVTVRAETSKSRHTRVIPFSTETAFLLGAYLKLRRTMTTKRGLLFLSESRRNHSEPITIWSWSKVGERIARMSGVSNYSTHTLRHLCLTDLARSGWDLHEIATFAGHQNIDSTKTYIHLGGRELAEKMKNGMAQIHAWRIASMKESLQ